MRSSRAEVGVTWVRETPLDSVVGMQQKTARPSVSSGEPRGRRCTARAASGVTSRMEAKPNAMAPRADSARAASPRLRPRPEMTKMPARAAPGLAHSYGQPGSRRAVQSGSVTAWLGTMKRFSMGAKRGLQSGLICLGATAARITIVLRHGTCAALELPDLL